MPVNHSQLFEWMHKSTDSFASFQPMHKTFLTRLHRVIATHTHPILKHDNMNYPTVCSAFPRISLVSFFVESTSEHDRVSTPCWEVLTLQEGIAFLIVLVLAHTLYYYPCEEWDAIKFPTLSPPVTWLQNNYAHPEMIMCLVRLPLLCVVKTEPFTGTPFRIVVLIYFPTTTA